MPALRISTSMPSHSIGSNDLKGLSFLNTKCTLEPNAFNMPTSSTAMYPAPTTTATSGNVSTSKNPSDVMQYSDTPSSLGSLGLP